MLRKSIRSQGVMTAIAAAASFVAPASAGLLAAAGAGSPLKHHSPYEGGTTNGYPAGSAVRTPAGWTG